jgi:hypothetical protein
MARPVTREQFKQYCLRSLGAPLNCINIDNEQLEDRIDDALDYFRDYHYDGTERVLIKHQITQADKDNRYITVDEDVQGIIRILDIGDSINSSNLFNIRYSIHLNELFDFSSASYVPYYMAMQHINMIEEIFVGKKPLRYNRHQDRLHIDMDWSNDVEVGEYLIIDGYKVLDPNVWTDVWNDRWLKEYAVQLIKRQWGTNLKKFGGVQLPGGITLNGDQIYQEANDEIRRLQDDMINSYSGPVMDMIG